MRWFRSPPYLAAAGLRTKWLLSRAVLHLAVIPCRRRALTLVALLLSVTCGLAQVPGVVSSRSIPASREPIAPIPQPPSADPSKIALGQRLFDDPRLSQDRSLACSSCHHIQTNGANAHQLGPASGGSEASFNTPTIFNAALNFRLNWEGNFHTLEDQARSVLGYPDEAPGSIDDRLKILAHDKAITQQFNAVYGHGPTLDSLLDALATYERSLLTPDSPFDRWLRGDAGAISADAVAGYNLFKSFGCVSCHQGTNVGGNLFEQSGIFHHLTSPQPLVFRVPSLRNVAVTAPYFHDGSAPTLQDAVRKMGYAQLDRKLSDDQIDLIVAFLDSLTGVYQGRALTPP